MMLTSFVFVLLISCIVFVTNVKRSSADCRISNVTSKNKFADMVYNCSNNGMTEIKELPNFPGNVTVALDLSFNKFQFINASSFSRLHGREKITVLILHHNKILMIDEHSFSTFSNIRLLNIASCFLKNKSISSAAFLGLTKLEELFIDDNLFYTPTPGYPSLQISHLRSLEKIHIDVFEGFQFDHYFTSLRKLREIIFNPQGLFHLTKKSFHGLSKCPIQYISLDFNGQVFCDISEELFCSLQCLKGLQMRIGSRCNVTRALRSLKCLQNRTMEYIDFNHIFPDIAVIYPAFLDNWAMEYLSNVCVKKLLLNHDAIEKFSFSRLGKPLLKCLNHLDLSGNQAYFTISAIGSLFKFKNIRFANFSRFMNNPLITKSLHFSRLNTFYLPSSLEVLDFSFFIFHDLDFGNATLRGANMTKLYLTKSTFVCRAFKTLDMPALELLDISECIFETIQPNFFQKLRKLKTLYARKSMQNVNLSGISCTNLFVSQIQLLFLDLSENALDSLHISLFRFQKNLKTLILDKNMFDSIPKALQNLHSLSTLSLKDNKIKRISETDISILHKLDNVFLKIGGNSVTCSCSAEDDLYRIKVNEYIFSDLEEVSCFESKYSLTRFLSDEKWRIYQFSCISSFWLKFSITLLLISIFLLIMVAGMYRNRVIVDYVFLRVRLLMRREKYNIDCGNFNFEVFISYSNADYDWVTSTLYNQLVDYGFRVCLHHKDFIPGNNISEEIVRCIDESRKILFVVTEDFLKSTWTSYEVQMAKQHAFQKHRDSMIIVLMKDDIAIARLPKELRNFWWKIVCAKWPQQESVKEIDMFWETLKSSIEQ